MRVTLGLAVACMVVLSGCVGVLSGDATDRTPSSVSDTATDRTPPKVAETPTERTPPDESREWDGADFPEAFETAPSIVTPDNPSTVESAAAARLAAMVRVSTGADPEVVPAGSVTDRQRDGAIIAIGQPDDSSFARLVAEADANATVRGLDRHEGSARITANPWNRSRPLALVSGADPAGLWAGVEALETDGTADRTRRYEPVSGAEMERLDANDTVSALTLGQLYTKREYFTQGPEATNGTYLDGARQSRLLFQEVTVYTTERFDDAELETLRSHGVRISQESWIPGGDDGSYTAVVPQDELDRLANHSSVTYITSQENVVSLQTGPSDAGRSDGERVSVQAQSDKCPQLSLACY